MAGKIYTINFVDPDKSLISLSPSVINGPSGFTRNTDLDLIGMGHSLWGEAILENLVHIMENFACSEDLHTIAAIDTGLNTITVSGNVFPSFPDADVFDITGSDTNDGTWTVSTSSYSVGSDLTTITVVEALNASVTLGDVGHIGWPNRSLDFSPINPIEGQIWYNQTRGQVFVYSEGTPTAPLAGHWERVGGITIDSTAPTSPSEGDWWWETTTYLVTDDEYGRNLHIYTGGSWVRVVDNYLPRNGSKAMQGHIDMGAFRIENLANPDSPDDALNLSYADARYVNATGDTMSGILNMGAQRIENLADPNSADDALNLSYADARYVNVTGDTMSGILNMGAQRIENLADPNSSDDAVNLGYADARYVNVTGDTITGPLILTSTLSVSHATPTISLLDSTAGADDFRFTVDSNILYIYSDRNDDGTPDAPTPLELRNTENKGYVYGDEILTTATSQAFPLYYTGVGSNIIKSKNTDGLVTFCCYVETTQAEFEAPAVPDLQETRRVDYGNGSVRAYLTVRWVDPNYIFIVRIWKNGVIVGQWGAGPVATTFSVDLSVVPGDKIKMTSYGIHGSIGAYLVTECGIKSNYGVQDGNWIQTV